MKTVDNQLYLLDFGAVKQVTGATSSTKSTGIYTTGYAPPEQVTGGQVFPASELYSLAVTCIVLLTGKETTDLFDSYSNRWLWQNHITPQDQNLALVLDKLLSASPQDRYSSAQAVLDALNPEGIKTASPASAKSAAPMATKPPMASTVSASAPIANPTTPQPLTQSSPKPNLAQQQPNQRKLLRPWMIVIALLAAFLGSIGGWWLRQREGTVIDNSSLVAVQSAASFNDIDVPPGQFNYGGSTTWAPIRGIVDPQLQQAIPDLDLAYRDPTNRPPGSGSGIQMLINGELDFAQTSRPITSEEKQQAQKQGITLQEIPVAIEGVAIVSHPELPISNVSQTQLKDIYTGRAVNWQELGGPDLPIVPISRNDIGGTVFFFSQAVLNGEDLAASVQRSNSTTEALRLTSNTPGAIYFASAPEIVGQCTIKPLAVDQQLPYQPPYIDLQNCSPNQRNRPNLEGFASGDYPLTRQISVVINPDKPIGQAYAELLLTEEGQAALNTAGFARIP